MQIEAIPALKDNYIWAIRHKNQAVVVDPGEAGAVLEYLRDRALDLKAIWITHHHADHTDGVAALMEAFVDCRLYAHADHGFFGARFCAVDEGSIVECFGGSARVWRSFGHTKSHLSYLLEDGEVLRVFCGDTLFRGGCGRVFCGTMRQLYDSFVRYRALPKSSVFYPAHEYTLANLRFAQSLEPNNVAVVAALRGDTKKRDRGQPTLPTTLEDEAAINPFLRSLCPNEDLWRAAKKTCADLAKDDAFGVFAALRAQKDEF